ncbi:TlpA family protein disulfide reductase [Alicyclobacillus sp. ALC3]|uniref:TlpA family protein disulfide reductase n=1 Tax=Alicyclobacillus sp. ALC3 TaxID=2796143 RepID=UPI002379832D|nr:TlpA disulfide reductase family protein [Alicyclobacillus sp. ALC3]WDL98801.1 TlpA family protein disulfide reductase [Alicyclobacillus sp. ALC3]
MSEVHVSRRRLIIPIAVMAVLVVLSTWIVAKYIQNQKVAGVGDQAPDITTTTISSTPFALSSLRGEPVFIDYFAPWCQPCIQETPDLVRFAERYGNRIHIVMVDRGDGVPYVRSYVRHYQLPSSITVLLDPNNHWSHAFGVIGQPETILVNGNGKIVSHLIGPMSLQRMVSAAEHAGMK